MRALLLLAVGCSAAPPAPSAPPLVPRELGLNDVSLLIPLPADPARPTLLGVVDGERSLIAEDLVASLVFANDIAPKNGLPVRYRDFHVVAVRFDPCTRAIEGACPDDADGRLRLVLQPMYTQRGATFAHDIALHALYPIPATELADVIDELRALAAIAPVPVEAPLAVRTSVADPAYAARLRSLVRRYAVADQLAELTVIGQQAGAAAFAWRFGGVVRGERGFVARTIPNLGEHTAQHVLVAGGDTVYHVTPSVDLPAGFGLALVGATFAAASAEDQRVALGALAELEHPLRHDADDTQCAGCHLATFLASRRAQVAGIELATLPNRYASRLDLRVDTIASTDPRVVRAFGWAGDKPAISQRVANDTSLALSNIRRRFGGPRM